MADQHSTASTTSRVSQSGSEAVCRPFAFGGFSPRAHQLPHQPPPPLPPASAASLVLQRSFGGVRWWLLLARSSFCSWLAALAAPGPRRPSAPAALLGPPGSTIFQCASQVLALIRSHDTLGQPTHSQPAAVACKQSAIAARLATLALSNGCPSRVASTSPSGGSSARRLDGWLLQAGRAMSAAKRGNAKSSSRRHRSNNNSICSSSKGSDRGHGSACTSRSATETTTTTIRRLAVSTRATACGATCSTTTCRAHSMATLRKCCSTDRLICCANVVLASSNVSRRARLNQIGYERCPSCSCP